MRRIFFFIVMMMAFKTGFGKKAKSLLFEYKKDGQHIEVYQKTFSGIWYILLKNNNRGYSIVCELNKGKKVFMWKGTGNKSFVTYNAVIDSAGSKFVGFHEIHLDKSVTPKIDRIHISPLEIELLYQGIDQCVWPGAKDYSYDLKKILFFGYGG